MHGGGGDAKEVMPWLPAVADKYGIIVLAAGSGSYMDSALKHVLRNFAIDPDRIAVVGNSNGGGYALGQGSANPDIFSRVGGMSPSSGLSSELADPRHNRNQQFFMSTGILEKGGLDGWFSGPFSVEAEIARKAGYLVKQALIMRSHQYNAGELDLFGRWLLESWAKPDPAMRKSPPMFAVDSIPLLTLDALTKITIFWTGFMQEPDSISQIARAEHQKEIVVPIGQERGSLLIMDTRIMAAKYPSVAADLKKAGLTAQQAEAYRIALITARATKQGVGRAGTVDSTSVMGRNIAFRHAHPNELRVLAKTGMWLNP
jgi:hypothetical protein